MGGFIIYARMVSNYLYLDVALGEGEINNCGTPKWGTKSAASVLATVESHVGAAGDTTSTIITAIEPTYTIPEGIAHVVLKIKQPAADTPFINPMDVSFEGVEGRLVYNPVTSTNIFSKNPILVALDALTNNRYSIGTPFANIYLNDWLDEQAFCDTDPGDGGTYWEFSARIDSRDTLEAQLNFMLAHCAGHLRYNNGRVGVWTDRVRDRALDNESNLILYCDNEDNTTIPRPNTAGEITWSTKNREQVSSVVIIEYTDHAAGDVDASTQIPNATDLDPAVDWIEKRYRLVGYSKINMADRMGTLLYNLDQLDKDIMVPTFRGGILAIPGDRICLDSRRLIRKVDTIANTGAVAGVEEVVVMDQKIATNQASNVPSVMLRCSLYRDTSFGPVTTAGTPPTPGDPPDGAPPPVGGSGGGGGTLAYIENLTDAAYLAGAQGAQFSVDGRGRVAVLGMGEGIGIDFTTGATQIDDKDIPFAGAGMLVFISCGTGRTVTLTGIKIDGIRPRDGDSIGIFLVDDGTLILQHDNGVDSTDEFRFQNADLADFTMFGIYRFAAYNYVGSQSRWMRIWKNF